MISIIYYILYMMCKEEGRGGGAPATRSDVQDHRRHLKAERAPKEWNGTEGAGSKEPKGKGQLDDYIYYVYINI